MRTDDVTLNDKCKKDQILYQQSEKRQVDIRFISENDNTNQILSKINKRSAQLSKKGVSEKKISEYENYEINVFYDGKESELPDIIFVFNSKRRVLKMPGYPCLMKEIAEIFECGNIQDFRAVEFITCFERYASIQQRWGL